MAACSLALSLYSFISSREYCRKEQVRSMLKDSAEELSKDSERKLRALESEWDVMYAKFGKLAGRMDRERALQPLPGNGKPHEEEPGPAPKLTHSDILRGRRNT